MAKPRQEHLLPVLVGLEPSLLEVKRHLVAPGQELAKAWRLAFSCSEELRPGFARYSRNHVLTTFYPWVHPCREISCQSKLAFSLLLRFFL